MHTNTSNKNYTINDTKRLLPRTNILAFSSLGFKSTDVLFVFQVYGFFVPNFIRCDFVTIQQRWIYCHRENDFKKIEASYFDTTFFSRPSCVIKKTKGRDRKSRATVHFLSGARSVAWLSNLFCDPIYLHHIQIYHNIWQVYKCFRSHTFHV